MGKITLFIFTEEMKEEDYVQMELPSVPHIGDEISLGGVQGFVKEVFWMDDCDEEDRVTGDVAVDVLVGRHRVQGVMHG